MASRPTIICTSIIYSDTVIWMISVYFLELLRRVIGHKIRSIRSDRFGVRKRLSQQNEMWNQCCFNVGPASKTVALTLNKHWLNVSCLLGCQRGAAGSGLEGACSIYTWRGGRDRLVYGPVRDTWQPACAPDYAAVFYSRLRWHLSTYDPFL